MAEAKHIIRKQRFTVRHEGQTDVFSLQRTSEQFCKEQLLPAIEALFDANEDGRVIRLDKVKLQFNISSIADLNNWLVQDIVAQFDKEIQKAKSERNPGSIVSVHDAIALFIFYLKHGYLPASINKTVWQWQQELLQEIKQLSSNNRSRLLQSLQHQHAIERFTALQNDVLFWELLNVVSIASSQPGIVSKIISIWKRWVDTDMMKDFITSQKLLLAKTLIDNDARTLEQLSGFVDDVDVLVRTKGNKISKLDLKKALDKIAKAIQKNLPPNDMADMEVEELPTANEKLFISNAGLVIIHPFLTRFFTNLGIEWKTSISEKERAVCLLHYIATDKETFEQYEIVLPKLLLGIPVNEIVEARHRISIQEVEEIKKLLQAVIHNWEKVGNTSTGGLQHSFLQRTGSLEKREQDWHLYVEAAPYDILLDYLPWSISMIKLPWMKELLTVQWEKSK